MLLRVRRCVAAHTPSMHAFKLRPSIAAARAIATTSQLRPSMAARAVATGARHAQVATARAVATRRSSHAAVAVSEHRLHPPFARYAHGTVVEPHSQLVFTSGTLGTCCYWIASYAVIHLLVFVRKMIA